MSINNLGNSDCETMSASKFCRNFLSFPPLGVAENSGHITRERQHQNDLKMRKTPDFHTAAHVNAKEQEDFSISLIAVYIPESRQNSHDCNVPRSRKGNIYNTQSSAWFKHVQFIVSSKLPSGSTLVNDRGIFHTVNTERPFACAFCGKAYKTKRHVYSHIRHVHDKKNYTCEICDKSYGYKDSLAKHVRIHSQEKPFTCGECGKLFRQVSNLRNHKYTHSKERLFHCDICNKSYKTRVALSRHNELHQPVEQRKGVACDICKRKFSLPSLLKEHMMIHTGEKPFKCTLCKKQFRMKIQLRNHMDSHLGKKRLGKPCSVCGKTLWATHMSDHMRMHTGEKPFECNICKKRFPKKQNLEGHIRSHTGEKPFACDRCDKRFALYSNMVTHKAKCTFLHKKTSFR